MRSHYCSDKVMRESVKPEIVDDLTWDEFAKSNRRGTGEASHDYVDCHQ